jgi:hypothetical protein
MKTRPGLPRSSSQRDLTLKISGQKPVPTAKSLPRAAKSWSHALDRFDREPLRPPTRRSSTTRSKPVTRAVCQANDGSGPCMVTFPTELAINQRIADEALWPKGITRGLVAVMYRFCGVLIGREAEKTYSVKDAAEVVQNVLAPMRQAVNIEKMRLLEVVLAHAYVPDAALCRALKKALCERWESRQR